MPASRIQSSIDRFVIRKPAGRRRISDPGELIYLEAREGDTLLRMRKAEKLTDVRRLDELTPLLARYGFSRIHRTYLVNLCRIYENASREQLPWPVSVQRRFVTNSRPVSHDLPHTRSQSGRSFANLRGNLMRPLRCFLLALLIASPLAAAGAVSVDAQSADSSRRRAARPLPIGLEIFPLIGHHPALASTSDLEPFRALVGDASVVGLGESWHMSGGFYLLKHRLFRFLVEEMGFRAFAIESNWEAVERTGAYVQSCSGTAEAAIREEHTVWQSTEYADLIRWMCQWNSARPDPADRLTIFGFDIQQPERDGPGLAAFVGQFGLSQSDPRVSGLRSCEKAYGLSHPFGEIPPAVHARCLDALDGIEEFLQSRRTTIVESTSQGAFDIAMLRVVGLRANQEQIFEIRDHFARGFNYRDAAMAYAFHLRRAMRAPGAKTAVWAADVHIAQNLLPGGELPMGSHLAATLGADYVSFAITAYETEVPRSAGVCGLTARTAGSVEEQLATYGHQTLLARPRGGEPQFQIMPMGFFTFRPFADFDGIFFLKHSPAMHPLLWQPCR